eukprot:SAG22_NODE_2846_length_2161_cov_2.347721_3_plen_187_part_00
MKETGKKLTLRGSVTKPVGDNFSTNGFKILEYANVLDLKKAWKVEGYAIWPVGWRTGFGADTSLASASIESFLATDGNITDSATVFIANNARDNRQIAWGNTWITTGSGDKALSIKVQAVRDEHYWIDPSHIVQNDLRLFLRIGSTEAYEGEPKEINYIIYLREVEITPSESIIQNVKGKSQDLSN